MGTLLMKPEDPFVQEMRGKKSQRTLDAFARRLHRSSALRAARGKRYLDLVAYFTQHEEQPFLWANDPLLIERTLIQLEEEMRRVPETVFPQLYVAATQIRTIAERSARCREQHLPHKKIIPFDRNQKTALS